MGAVVGNEIAGTACYSTVPVQIGTSTWLKIALVLTTLFQ